MPDTFFLNFEQVIKKTNFYLFYICLKIKIKEIININLDKIVNKILIKNDKIFTILKT